jgi:dTDP-4-amino-4,6-dideoxygalactose transaminase
MHQIPLVNLQRQYQQHCEEFNQAILKTMQACDFVLGKAVQEFEEKFAAYLGVKNVIGVASGTDALALILKAIGCKQGDVVLTQDNTFIATTLAILSAGAKVALCDISEDNYSMNLSSYNGARPKVVMPVHLYGFPCDLTQIEQKYGNNVMLVEDTAQAHGSTIKGRRCGSFGIANALSFYPSKNLGAFGDAGAVATNDDNLAQEVRYLRNWGSKTKYIHEREGGNSRLDTMQAAVLLVKLKYLDEWNLQRNHLANLYRKHLQATPEIILPPLAPEGCFQNYHLFVIRLKTADRDSVLKQLQEQGIGAGIHYPVPIHKQKVYANYEFAKQGFPIASNTAQQILSLPIYPEMTQQEVECVCEVLTRILEQTGRK